MIDTDTFMYIMLGFIALFCLISFLIVLKDKNVKLLPKLVISYIYFATLLVAGSMTLILIHKG